MCGSVLRVLDFHGHDGTRNGSLLVILLVLFLVQQRQEVRRQRRVESVGEQRKLELNLRGQRGRWVRLRSEGECGGGACVARWSNKLFFLFFIVHWLCPVKVVEL